MTSFLLQITTAAPTAPADTAAAAANVVDAGVIGREDASFGSSSASSNVPDYYITKPLLLPGKQ